MQDERSLYVKSLSGIKTLATLTPLKETLSSALSKHTGERLCSDTLTDLQWKSRSASHIWRHSANATDGFCRTSIGMTRSYQGSMRPVWSEYSQCGGSNESIYDWIQKTIKFLFFVFTFSALIFHVNNVGRSCSEASHLCPSIVWTHAAEFFTGQILSRPALWVGHTHARCLTFLFWHNVACNMIVKTV